MGQCDTLVLYEKSCERAVKHICVCSGKVVLTHGGVPAHPLHQQKGGLLGQHGDLRRWRDGGKEVECGIPWWGEGRYVRSKFQPLSPNGSKQAACISSVLHHLQR